MAYITVEQWDAVEIFCRILVKYEKKLKLKQFQDNEFLKQYLKDYSKGNGYLKVAAKIFGEKHNDENDKGPIAPKAFYELCRKIRNGIPVVLSDDEYKGFMKYINLPAATFPYKLSGTWEPNDKQRDLEGTSWLIYYLHRDRKPDDETNECYVQRDGIVRAILYLKPFAKAEIKSFKPSECYEGKFEIYDKEKKFIRLNMKLKKHRTKDLSMLVYVGNSDVELALGQYHNLGRSIYSATVMLEPFPAGGEKEDTIHFFTGNKIKTLPQHVQDYFSDKPKNMMRVPCKVTSVLDFEEWHTGKNRGKARKEKLD